MPLGPAAAVTPSGDTEEVGAGTTTVEVIWPMDVDSEATPETVTVTTLWVWPTEIRVAEDSTFSGETSVVEAAGAGTTTVLVIWPTEVDSEATPETVTVTTLWVWPTEMRVAEEAWAEGVGATIAWVLRVLKTLVDSTKVEDSEATPETAVGKSPLAIAIEGSGKGNTATY